MMRKIVVLALLMLVVVLVALAGAQTPAPPAPGIDWKSMFSWKQFVAAAINCLAVLAIVQFLKGVIPWTRVSVPWLLPLLTMLPIGPGIALVQDWLAAWLGWPIDLSPIIAVFTGGAAVAIHQSYRQSLPMAVRQADQPKMVARR
jgi:hypothetical protein